MNEKGNGQLLNRMMQHVKRRHTGAAEVSVKLDESGRYISPASTTGVVADGRKTFSSPKDSRAGLPSVRPRAVQEQPVFPGPWGEGGDLYGMFVDFYDSIIRNY